MRSLSRFPENASQYRSFVTPFCLPIRLNGPDGRPIGNLAEVVSVGQIIPPSDSDWKASCSAQFPDFPSIS